MRTSRRPYLGTIVAETVVIHTTKDESIRGVLLAVHSDVFVLHHAALLSGDTTRIPIDGEVLVPLPQVKFVQRLLEPA